jgi:aryl-alcohol dehydrogenase-like predicted oxidoreductase
MEYRWLGASGLKVSALTLGTMGFGGAASGGWVATIDEDEARTQVRLALDAGVNLFDTANGYAQGESERLLGRALGADRQRVLVSTKVHARVGDGPNDVGQSRWHVLRACEDSLRRLGTDYIDVYHVHGFDACTPLEETLGALDDLVRSGKVRYIACSNYAAWQIMKALSVSDQRGMHRYVATQSYYSLVARELENEILPLCVDQGLGALVWSPLAGGFLSGKFSPREPAPENTRRAMIGDLGVGHIDLGRGHTIVEVARAIATTRSVSVAQVALRWVLARPAVSSVIVGARTAAQLADNLAASQWVLDADEVAALDEASEPERPYPVWYQRQFTAERHDRTGAPDGAFAYRFVTPSDGD